MCLWVCSWGVPIVPIRPAVHFSYFSFRGYFANVYVKHTTKCETLPIHFRISGKFRVLVMPWKNKPRNPLSFRPNADPGAKCCERQKGEKRGMKCEKGTRSTKREKGARSTKCEKGRAKYTAIHFSFFAFHPHFCIFRDKCIASLAGFTVQEKVNFFTWTIIIDSNIVICKLFQNS